MKTLTTALAATLCVSSVVLTAAFSTLSTQLVTHACSQSLSTRPRPTTHLDGIPTAAWSAIGHVIGGTSGAVVVMPATKPGSWYRKIDLPSFTPPDSIFAPVWTTLYAAMGVAAARVCKISGISSPVMKLWAFHYVLNLIWAPVFFGMKRLRLAMAINFLLLASLVVVMNIFYNVDQMSAVLLIPYLAWTVFATVLNGAICKRNPTDKNGMNNAKFQSELCKMQEEAAAYADSW